MIQPNDANGEPVPRTPSGLVSSPRWSVALVVAVALASQAHPATAFLILPLFAIAGLLQMVLQPRAFDRRIDALEASLLVWLLAWLASAVLATDVAHGFALSAPTLVFVLAFCVLYRDDAGLIDVAVGMLGLLGLLQSAIALWASHQSGGPQQWLLASDLPWLLVPNDLIWMLCLWPLWWNAWARSSRSVQSFGLVLFALQVALMATMQSRLALLVVFGLVVGWLGTHAPRPWLHSATARVFAAAAAIALLATLFAFGKGIGTLQARGQLWKAAFELWWSHPWFGVGPHGFGLAYRDVIATELVDPRHTPWPHQLPLELLANTGLIGFAAFCGVAAIVAIRVQSLRKLGQLRPGLAPALLCFAAVSLVEASTLRLWWWVVLALLLACCKPCRSRISE